MDKFKIDREAETEKIIQYQKEKDPTKKEELFNELYETRLPTLKYWAHKYANNVGMSEEDLLQEISVAFLNACDKFQPNRLCTVKEKNDKGERKKKKIPFNTFLYISLTHFIKSMMLCYTTKTSEILNLNFKYENTNLME